MIKLPIIISFFFISLFLTISFKLVGYTITLSTFFGVIGAIAFTLIVTWWNDAEVPPKVEPKAQEIAQENQKSLITIEANKNPEINAKSPTKNIANSVTLWDWMFRQKG
jgi:hypothetical protein